MSGISDTELEDKKSSSGISEDEGELVMSVENSPESGRDSDASYSKARDQEEDSEQGTRFVKQISDTVIVVSRRLKGLTAAKATPDTGAVDTSTRLKGSRKMEDDTKSMAKKGKKFIKYSSSFSRLSKKTREVVRKDETASLKPEADDSSSGEQEDDVQPQEEEEQEPEESEGLEKSLNSTLSDSIRERASAVDLSGSSLDESVCLLPSPSSPCRKPVPPELINVDQGPACVRRPLRRKTYCADDVLKKATEKLAGLAVD